MQITNTAIQEIKLVLDERAGNRAQCLPALAYTVHEEAGAGGIFADMLAIMLAQPIASTGTHTAITIERGVRRVHAEAVAPPLDHFSLKTMLGTPNDDIWPDDHVPITTSSQADLRHIGVFEDMSRVRVEVGPNELPRLLHLRACHAKDARDVGKVMLTKRVQVALYQRPRDGMRRAGILKGP